MKKIPLFEEFINEAAGLEKFKKPEDLMEYLKSTGKLDLPVNHMIKQGSLLDRCYQLRTADKDSSILFYYDPTGHKKTPFGIISLTGYGLFRDEFLTSINLRQTQTWKAGLDNWIYDGMYNPKWIDIKGMTKLILTVDKGYSSYASSFYSFYANRHDKD